MGNHLKCMSRNVRQRLHLVGTGPRFMGIDLVSRPSEREAHVVFSSCKRVSIPSCCCKVSLFRDFSEGYKVERRALNVGRFFQCSA